MNTCTCEHYADNHHFDGTEIGHCERADCGCKQYEAGGDGQ